MFPPGQETEKHQVDILILPLVSWFGGDNRRTAVPVPQQVEGQDPSVELHLDPGASKVPVEVARWQNKTKQAARKKDE